MKTTIFKIIGVCLVYQCGLSTTPLSGKYVICREVISSQQKTWQRDLSTFKIFYKYIDLRINLRINLRIDPEVVSDWLSGDGVGEDDGAAP